MIHNDEAVRLVKPHKADCLAVGLCRDGSWLHPWAPEGIVFRDTLGRRNKGAYTVWYKFVCNTNPIDGCPAELLVCEDFIIEAATGYDVCAPVDGNGGGA